MHSKTRQHVFSKELQGGLCKYCLLFDDDDTRQSGKFVKTIFQDIGKSEKIKEHELTEHQKRNAEQAKFFILKNVIFECNLYILKLVIQAVPLCSKQNLPLPGHRDYGEFDVTRQKGTDEKTRRGNFHAVLNSFAMLDLTFRNHLKLVSLKNAFPANISTSDQSCFNVMNQR